MAVLRLAPALLTVVALTAGVVGACSTPPTFVDDVDGGTATGGKGGTGHGGSGGSGASGGAGSECAIAADCPGVETECATRACDNGICSMSYTPAGTPVGLQVGGDCKKNACDGMGETVEQDDATDVPVDGNDCTLDQCDQGFPANPAAPANTPCGTDGLLSCDANGVCQGCTTDAQCGADSACTHQVCSMGGCYQTYTPDGGGQVSGQTAEDCLKIVCNGVGGTKTVEDQSDVKPDGNLCTQDFCSGGITSYQSLPPQDDNNACTQDACNPATGQTDHTPLSGNSCGGCMICDAGTCQSQCGACETCVGGQCQSTCQTCETCQNGQCVSACGGACQSCQNNQCVGGCGPCETCQGNQCVPNCGPCQTCQGGSCVGGCGPCETCQGDQCVGSCGPCQTCQGGSCTSTCSACQTCQGGACVDNCGPCQTCTGGSCVSQCNAGACESCINGSCQYACGGCDFCNAGTCEFDPCCGDPCCGDPCCAKNLPLPPPCW